MSSIIEHTTPQDIQAAEDNGARAYAKNLSYSPPSEYQANPWLENAWRRGFVRAKHLDTGHPLTDADAAAAE